MSEDIYRLKVGINLSASGSTSKWTYHEDLDALAAALTEAHVDALAGVRGDAPNKLARIWRRLRTSDPYPSASRVIAVEKHTDAGWTPIPYRVIEPGIEWTDA